ncbi:MAG: 30S ribosomal protein S13 [Candidatus Beckwithbacteria bacterium GW2011_GWC2_47_9]|uniref:Small ribosomal subunit protein uS13 n=3 Tax=Candidatus Beckwithiibacteriota TaxID=1752726 RepID=A0A0G1WA72_9BACT|nr:MAG: 30S ribosomal protein S13 [Candidatus Beckwithbacteria bacterium GW2011_GWC2_47_9]OGD55418.1 MAG: 30S ribosomal protein S13 [Candidatus Beckwithbacteria bacterium RIFCSPHIGHO2_12_FULL_47_17]OGD61864.1 MAG: 30S ribosomal protein S13 [Candidatus Beckwithbacteria bacterium RIFCSPLOWO2_02_FULL_47_23]
MPRISGVDVPQAKRTEIALTAIYGIGRSNVGPILKLANVDGNKRAKDLSSDEVMRLTKAVETVPTEGSLRKLVTESIKRLRQIGTYRGSRHAHRLPARGQRTRHNARTKRGKRMTVGALKKEEAAKIGEVKKEEEKK